MAKLDLKIFPPNSLKGTRKRRRFPKSQLKNKPVTGDEINYNPILVSSAHGKIKTLVFNYPDMASESLDDKISGLHSVITKLASKMKQVEHFIVVTNEKTGSSEIETYLKNKLGKRVHICKVVPDKQRKFSNWASDLYKAALYKKETEDEYRLFLVEPSLIHIANSDDQHVVDWMLPHIEEHLSSSHETLDLLKHNEAANKLKFDGGNILVGDDFVLLGGDIKKANEKKENSELFKKFLFGDKEPFFLEATPPKHRNEEDYITNDKVKNKLATTEFRGIKQPIFHLDLFITLGGRLNKEQYQLVIGQPVVGLSVLELAEIPIDLAGVIYEQVYKMEYSISMVIKQLSNILNENGTAKFKIVRVPLPLTYHSTFDSENRETRNWYWASYNNCLVEIDEKPPYTKSIWLPSYSKNYGNHHEPKDGEMPVLYGNWRSGLNSHEREVKRIWKKELSFENVTMINADFNMYIQKKGSLACLINCIEREIQLENT